MALVTCLPDGNLPNSACGSSYPNRTLPGGLQLEDIWNITKIIGGTCPNDSRISSSLVPALTLDACIAIAGAGATAYALPEIWSRLTTWKFPLAQLVATFPRPPLGLKVDVFVIAHLLGNPIGTLKNLILKLACCQHRAEQWHRFFNQRPGYVDGHVRPRDARIVARAFALVNDAYDEWGFQVGDDFQATLQETLDAAEPYMTQEQRSKLVNLIREKGDALAANRATKFLPVSIALTLFIGVVAMAVTKTSDAAAVKDSKVFVNLEAHSIAFTALYFWIISAIILAAVIGSSQSEESTPRILRGLQSRMLEMFPDPPPQMIPGPTQPEGPARPSLRIPLLHDPDHPHIPSDSRINSTNRILRGGIYSWYSQRIRNDTIAALPRNFWVRPGSTIGAVIIVAGSWVTGLMISYYVPPEMFGCRCKAEVAIAAPFIVNAALDYVPALFHKRLSIVDMEEFWFAFWKDLITAVWSAAVTLATVIGILNRCDCYVPPGGTGVLLPQTDEVADILGQRIQTVYPAIAFTNIALQLLVVPACLYWRYPEGIRVYLRRDDHYSNLWWVHSAWGGLRRKLSGRRRSSHVHTAKV